MKSDSGCLLYKDCIVFVAELYFYWSIWIMYSMYAYHINLLYTHAVLLHLVRFRRRISKRAGKKFQDFDRRFGIQTKEKKIQHPVCLLPKNFLLMY